ncbi:hypothetical protein [Rhodococcus opacus]|uniref:hypothetical protein n=1 Tax=Rhodococcus opacus TaxID=37919 RepID=UPI0034D274E7
MRDTTDASLCSPLLVRILFGMVRGRVPDAVETVIAITRAGGAASALTASYARAQLHPTPATLGPGTDPRGLLDVIDRDALFARMARDRARELVAHIGFLRSLRQLHDSGVTEAHLAVRNGCSAAEIGHLLARARVEAPDIAPGSRGGTAYEIAARGAAGELDPATVRAELISWVYEPADAAVPAVPGGFDHQVGRAYTDGPLTDDDYDLIRTAVTRHDDDRRRRP